MVEVKNKQIVITLETTSPEEDIVNLRKELLECITNNFLDTEMVRYFMMVDLLKGLSPTLEQEEKIHKQLINTL